MRFPEFRDSEGWSTPKLSDIYRFKQTNTLSREKLNYKTGTIRNIHYGDIHTRFKPIFRIDREKVPYINPNVSIDAFKVENDCAEGDIVLADASEDLTDVGKAIELVSLDNHRVVAGTHTILATRRGSEPILGFGGHLFQSDVVRAGIQKESQGTKVFGISANRISSVKLPLPPTKHEQQQIADCLSSLDDLITAEDRKLEALKTYKQGLMQEIFPKIGQTQPRSRFPEFNGAPGWEEKRLDEVIFPIVRKRKKPSEAYTGLGLRSHGKGTFLKKLIDPDKNSAEYLFEVKCNDLVVNITFAWEGAVAIAGTADDGALVSHRFPTYTFEMGAAIPDFFRYLIFDKQFIYKLGVISPGGAGRNRVLDKKAFLKLNVMLPRTEEQRSIADCLTTLDNKITAQSVKIDSLEQHKRGLMQQLFPTVKEV
jgi:type I restriction enzyme S subunit